LHFISAALAAGRYNRIHQSSAQSLKQLLWRAFIAIELNIRVLFQEIAYGQGKGT